MNENFQDAMTKSRKLQLLALVLALAVGGLVYAFMKPQDTPALAQLAWAVWWANAAGCGGGVARLDEPNPHGRPTCRNQRARVETRPVQRPNNCGHFTISFVLLSIG